MTYQVIRRGGAASTHFVIGISEMLTPPLTSLRDDSSSSIRSLESDAVVGSKDRRFVFMVRSRWIGWNELCAAMVNDESAESHTDRFLAEKPRRSAFAVSAKRRGRKLPLLAGQVASPASA